jgi:hypothetical protein
MSFTLVIASLVIPPAVLLADYGRRRLTTMRILRPFIATAIVAPGLDLGGRGLLLEAAGIAAGVLLGLLASAAMRVERDPGTSIPMTVAGVPYVAIWVAVALARLALAYEARLSARRRSPGRWAGSWSRTTSARPRWPTRSCFWASECSSSSAAASRSVRTGPAAHPSRRGIPASGALRPDRPGDSAEPLPAGAGICPEDAECTHASFPATRNLVSSKCDRRPDERPDDRAVGGADDPGDLLRHRR